MTTPVPLASFVRLYAGDCPVSAYRIVTACLQLSSPLAPAPRGLSSGCVPLRGESAAGRTGPRLAVAELGYGPPGVNHMDFTSRKTHFSLLPYQIKSDITGHSTVPVADGGLPGEESDGNLHDAPHWVPHDDPGTRAPL